METLTEYNKNRDFSLTAEPEGKLKKSEDSLRYLVQHHIARRDHYDFRLEWKGALLSWAVPKGPSFNVEDKRLAIRVEDHPLDYRDFEGTIPKGEYGGGTVMLWDEGYWEPYGDIDEGLRKGALKFTLYGMRLKGKWALIKIKDDKDDKENWLLFKEKDEYAENKENIAEYDKSIRTGRTMEEITEGKRENAAKNPFDRADVQLAKPIKDIPKGDDWVYEVKYDGYRILGFVESNKVRLISRNNKDYTHTFRSVAQSLADMAKGRVMVLDGEIAVTNSEGRTDFQALQGYIKNPKGKGLTYIIFDLLSLEGEDLRNMPLLERKSRLEALMKEAPENLHYSRHVIGKGAESFKAACGANMEGIVGKRGNSPYSGTRNGDWVKIKCDNRQEFVVGGYTLSDKKNSGISSLLLGVYEGEDLIYVGRAGSGLTEADNEQMTKKFKDLLKNSSPFRNTPKPSTSEKFFWLEPRFAAEVRFAEWTSDNLLRQASFKGLREDKNVKEIIRENAAKESPEEDKELESVNTVEDIKITHPDKVIFDDPRVTKQEVIKYYSEVSRLMLPYLSGRILSIVRCPQGVSKACFYKKHPGPGSTGIVTVSVTNEKGEKDDFFYIESDEGLLSEAQMGTLEFHTWGSRYKDIDKPDIMVFDLDPDEGLSIDKVRQGVLDLKEILSELKLKSYLKTSGGKGYHVVVPFKPSVNWNVFYDFARRIAEVMDGKWPDRYTTNVRKVKRADKIFIDWMRNGRGATSVAPYSLRARKGAKVSMPIEWDELNTVAPDGIDMKEALNRLNAPDPWKDFFKTEQEIK
jgi:bifunctional non-homologous end joining protein LigD